MLGFILAVLVALIGFLNFLAINGQFSNQLNHYVMRNFKVPETVLGAKAEDADRVVISETKPALKDGSPEFVLSASSGLAWDWERDFYLFEKDADRELPIASISKLMSALVFLDYNPGWHEIYTISASDKREGNRLNFFPGEQVYIRDLFYSALVASDNSSIISLVRASGLSEVEFVQAMNKKAGVLGMERTKFVEPTGLSDYNTATARDVAKLIQASMKDLDIRRAVLADKYELEILNVGSKKQQKRVVQNTDQLLRSADLDIELIGGKTGYLHKAGYCFAGSFAKDGRQIVTVVLGAADQDARFQETARLLDWVFSSYNF